MTISSGGKRAMWWQSLRAAVELRVIPKRDGCPGLATAIQTVYPRALHQRCWVHKMRNILEKVRKRHYDAVRWPPRH